jgi:predicted glycosyltransferase
MINKETSSTHKPKVLFYVQHLLGIGHLKRAATLSRAMEAAGLAVTIVSGGKSVPGVNIGSAQLIQLPPMRSKDEHFSVMLDDNDQPVDDGLRSARRDMLLNTVAKLKPSLVLTELFPFGRRHLRGEIIPMIEAALNLSPRPKIICSVRDILVEPSKKERGPEMVEMVQRYYDHVLVHGDPDLVPFDETFPLASRIADRLSYTGYIVDPPPHQKVSNGIGTDEVIVSAGGGALSEPLFSAAIDARSQTVFAKNIWRLLAGPSLPPDAYDRLQSKITDGVILERARPDFTSMLANCALSVSQGGYNTVMDILATQTRAVIAPYAGGKETEQTLRARLLSADNLFQVVWEQDLSTENLAGAINTAAARAKPTPDGIATDGAERSAALLANLVGHEAGTAS